MIIISAIKTEIFENLWYHYSQYHLFFLALVPIFGIEVKGAKRWIDLYFFRLQPIEILKPFLF